MANDYFNTMLSRRVRTDGFIDPCIPTLAAKPPSGPDWVHEIKHDGYRTADRPQRFGLMVWPPHRSGDMRS